MLGAGDEVVEDVLLVGEVSVFVPLLAVVGAAADVGEDEDAALVEPESSGSSGEVWLFADSVAAVSVEKGGCGAVDWCSLAADDGEGYVGSVFGDGELADCFCVVEVVGEGGREGGAGWICRSPIDTRWVV